jgi:hypothetical protein
MYCEKCSKEFNPLHEKCPKCGFIPSKRQVPILEILFLIFISCSVYLVYDYDFSSSPQLSSIESSLISTTQAASVSEASPVDPTTARLQLIKQINQQYYLSHTYEGDDVYDCDNMAQDVWNMLKTANITSKIMLGNTGITGETVMTSNHAWLLACVNEDEDQWVAVECTNGSLVFNNAQYYEGLQFNDPKTYRTYRETNLQMLTAYNDYITYLNRYNELITQYNTKPTPELLGQVNESYVVLKDKETKYETLRLKMDEIYKSQ